MSSPKNKITDTINIRDIMIPSIVFISKETSISIVAKKLLKTKGRTVVVGSKKNPLGLITDHDFVQVLAHSNPKKYSTAEDLMSFPLITVDAHSNCENALRIFRDHPIHRLLVVENNMIVGLLTIPTLMNFFNIAVEELREKLELDGLTQLKNKTTINQILVSEFNNINTTRAHTESIVIFIDIDHFKKINDVYGHLIGDIVLKEMSLLLKEQIRASDEVGRFGGEEFIILLRRIHLPDALLFANKIRENVEKFVFDADNNQIKLCISLGTHPISKGYNITDVISKADDALYHAKGNGRNCTGYWKNKELAIFRV